MHQEGRINQVMLVRNPLVRLAANKTYFLDVKLFNGKNEIPGKKWDFEGEPPKNNMPYFIEGAITEFKGQPQVIIDVIRPARDDEYNPRQFIPICEHNIDELWHMYLTFKNDIQNEFLKNILHAVINKYGDRIKEYPASISRHQAYIGGLLYHTVTVTRTAVRLAERPNVNRDLVLAGALLHDIGKCEVYDLSKGYIDFNLVGQTEDHIVVGAFIIERIAEEVSLPEYLKLNLLHIILAHHGKKEWGSPVEPRTPEAFIVHTADVFEVKIDTLPLIATQE